MGLTIRELCTVVLYPDSIKAQEPFLGLIDAIKNSRKQAITLTAFAVLEAIAVWKIFPREGRVYKVIATALFLTGALCSVLALRAVKLLYDVVRAFERGMKSTNSSSMPSLELLTAKRVEFSQLYKRLAEREELSAAKRLDLSAEDSALLQELKQCVAIIKEVPLAEIEKLSLSELFALVFKK
jgi:hypothetical protein